VPRSVVLQDWSSTDVLMTSSREAALRRLQPLVEMQEFLEFIAQEANFRGPSSANGLISSWTGRSPHMLTDPTTVWDDVVTNR